MPHRTAVLALLALALTGCGRGPRPDVVVVSIDSLRPDHLSCYGYPFPTSPTIDRLAREGVRFENALTTSSWTLPAHAALFTGLYDSGHGLVDNGLTLNPAQVTAAEVFARNGWRTAGFFGGPYLHPVFGLDQGFETYQSCMTQLEDDLAPEEVRASSRSRWGASHADVTGPRTVAEVTRWLAEVGDEPIFLFVHLWDVHYDFIAPPEYVALFDPDYTGELTGVDFMENPAIAPGMDERDFRHLLALYDAEIRYTDDTLAQILGLLERRGRMDDTLLVVTADHGEEFLEHGRKGHQRTLYEEVVRIPLIFRGAPGRFAAAGSAPIDQVRLIDVMPTLYALCGIDDVPAMNGRDLSPLLAGRALEIEPALLELYANRRDMQAVRMPTFKMFKAAPQHAGSGFDLLADPHERVELGPQAPFFQPGLSLIQRELAAALELGKGRFSIPADDIDPRMLERLKSLGYIGVEGPRDE
ncbi:MAG TPA: sulfatase [Planctomycetota bacterium]|nr:sulfatase [Planctomycetota bacterium]